MSFEVINFFYKKVLDKTHIFYQQNIRCSAWNNDRNDFLSRKKKRTVYDFL